MPRKKPVINLDVDGPLADFVGGTLLHLFVEHDVVIHRTAVTAYDFHKLPHFEPWQPAIVKAWNSKGFCAGLRPVSGAQAAVARLRQFADIKFVTAPMVTNEHWKRERTRWLRAYFDAPAADVIFDHDKTKYPALMFVDDKPSHVFAHQEAHPDGLALVWATTYNQDHHPRVDDWNTIVTIGERLCKSKSINLPTTKAKLLNLLSGSPKKPERSQASASSKASPVRARRTR